MVKCTDLYVYFFNCYRIILRKRNQSAYLYLYASCGLSNHVEDLDLLIYEIATKASQQFVKRDIQ